MTGAQQGAGVDPNQKPVNTVTPEVSKRMKQGETSIANTEKEMNAEGKPLEKEAEQKTDPTANSNVWNAGANALSMLAPDGTSKLLKDAGVMPDNASVANQTADNYKGSTTDAVIDTAIFAGGMALGGVGGKALGRGADGVFKIAEKTGDAAEATALKVAAETEKRVAAKGLEKEAAAMAAPEARAAAEVAASRAGAKAEVAAQQTVEGTGKIAGVVAGGAVANQLTGEQGALDQPAVQPAIGAVKKTDAAVLNIVSDEVNAAKEQLPTTKN